MNIEDEIRIDTYVQLVKEIQDKYPKVGDIYFERFWILIVHDGMYHDFNTFDDMMNFIKKL